ARPHGPPFRRSGLQRFRAEEPAERPLPAQLLDLLRAGRGQPQSARRIHRAKQDPVGDRLPAPRRVLPRRTPDDQGPTGGRVPRGSASGDGGGRNGLLRPELTLPRPAPAPSPPSPSGF